MNAAARVMNQSSVFQGKLAEVHVSRQVYLQTVMIILMLVSALAVVYTINVHRMTCSQLQFAEQQSHQLQLQWGQLLLEQASLATPARVEQLATEKLHMVLPVNKQAFVLRAQ
jgi:cell division protein FtsL